MASPRTKRALSRPGAAAASLLDGIAANRAVAPPDVAQLPRLPAGYRETDRRLRARSLRKVGAAQVSQARHALAEQVAHQATLREDLGQYAPPAAAAEELLARQVRTSAALGRLRQLVACAEELDAIALHDIAIHLDALKRELGHHAKHKPELRAKYRELGRYFEQKSERIKRGIARGRRAPP